METEVAVKVEDIGRECSAAQKINDENRSVNETPFNPEEYLKMKVKLPDETEVFLFSYGPQCGKYRPLICHLCLIPCLNEEEKRTHIGSELHQRNLQRTMTLKRLRNNIPFRLFYSIDDEGILVQFEINPGENIPEITDEYRDRIYPKRPKYASFKPNSEDLEILKQEPIHEYNRTMPLLGLDYIFKMMQNNKVLYFCAICQIKLKEEAFQHIVSAKHQTGYILKHFPRTYAKVKEGLKVIINAAELQHGIRNIFRQLHKTIENNKGRRRINFIEYNYFQQNQEEILKECNECYHFGDDSFATFSFDEKQLEKLISKTLSGIQICQPDLKSLAKPELGYRTMVEPTFSNTPKKYEPPAKKRRKDFGHATTADWTVYKSMLQKSVDDINTNYKIYHKNGSHPQYDCEWRIFLDKRCKQLKKDKIDPQYHNFEFEWAPYWRQRMHQLYAKDIAKQKRELKKILSLPLNRSPSPMRQTQLQVQLEPMQWQPQLQQRPRHPKNMRWEPPPPVRSPLTVGFPNQMNQDHSMSIFTENAPIICTEPLSVISVLRVLTALEDQLGSIGPKAIEFLSIAVLYEKNNGSTKELLLDNDYYVFFATVREKFRGLLQTNVVDPMKIKAIQHCITEISSILELMDKSQTKDRVRQRKAQEVEDQRFLQSRSQIQPCVFNSVDTGFNLFGDGGINRNNLFGDNEGGNLQSLGGDVGGSNVFFGQNRNATGCGGGRNRNNFFGDNQGGNSQSFGGDVGGSNAFLGQNRNATGSVFGSPGDSFNRNIWVNGRNSDNSERIFVGVNFADENDNYFSRGESNSGFNFGSRGGNNSAGRNFNENDFVERYFDGNNPGGRNFGRDFDGDNFGRELGGDNSEGTCFAGGSNRTDYFRSFDDINTNFSINPSNGFGGMNRLFGSDISFRDAGNIFGSANTATGENNKI